MSEPLTADERPAINTKKIDTHPTVFVPQQITSVHVDQAKVAIDHSIQTATITLLTMHPIPKLSGGWDMQGVVWDMVGEIKMPVNSLTDLAIYFLTVQTGINVAEVLQREVQKNPQRYQDHLAKEQTGGLTY